jgi:predicted small lipoprotein YifL
MLKNFQKGLVISFSVLIILAFFVSGCGKKAPPKPPKKGKNLTFSQQLKHGSG